MSKSVIDGLELRLKEAFALFALSVLLPLLSNKWFHRKDELRRTRITDRCAAEEASESACEQHSLRIRDFQLLCYGPVSCSERKLRLVDSF